MLYSGYKPSPGLFCLADFYKPPNSRPGFKNMTTTLLPIARLFLSISLASTPAQAPAPLPEVSVEVTVAPKKIVDTDKTELLWFARAIFSETKDENEMTLIGCVIKNRVLSEYRGKTYKEVILAPGQFSGFHPSDPQYNLNMYITFESTNATWRKAVKTAEKIYSGETVCPISEDVRHFYSPISAARKPEWAHGQEPVLIVQRNQNELPRFVLYENIR